MPITNITENLIWQQMLQLRHQANQRGVEIKILDLYEIAYESLSLGACR